MGIGSTTHKVDGTELNKDADKVWDILTEATGKKELISCAILDNTDIAELVAGHAYSMPRIHTLSRGQRVV